MLGEFRHQIVNDRFRVKIWRARAGNSGLPPGKWFGALEWKNVPLTTITRKALATVFST